MTRHTIPFTVTFLEITTMTARLEANDDADARAKVTAMTTALSPADKARAFTIGKTEYGDFVATPNTRPYRVKVATQALYAIDVEATNIDDAEEIAEDLWTSGKHDDFELIDFEDTLFNAQVLP